MSSKAKSKSGREPVPLCRIGERVALSPAASADPSLERIVSRAIRYVDIGAGEASFRLHQFSSAKELDAQLAGVASLSFGEFLERFVPAPIERMAFLKGLFDVGGRMFRLHADPLFLAVARSLAEVDDLPLATIRLDVVDGYDTCIATVPSRAGFKEGDILVSFSSDALALGRIEKCVDFLARDNPRQKLAGVSFSGMPHAGGALLVGASGLARIEMELRTFADVDAVYSACSHADADRIALLVESDEEVAPRLNQLARRQKASPEIDEPLMGFRFVLDAAIPLANGVFACGWFHDPEERIAAVIAIDHGLEEVDISAVWKLFDGRAEIGGQLRPVQRYAAFLPRAVSGAAAGAPFVPVRVVLANGDNHLITPVAAPQDLVGLRERILDTIAGHAFGPDMLAEVYGPALAPIQEALNARQAVRHVREFGTRSDRKVSIIIPLYRETGFIRSQLFAFAIDAFVRQHCEIVYVLDDPLIAPQVASLLEGAAPTFPLDLKLVTLERNGGYALANNMGVTQADGEVLILMNSDVIPDRSGWIEPALDRLAALPPFSVIGPKLLYADDSLQHAGMYFHRLSTGYWQNFHHWKGYGRHFPPADQERVVPAVTGACMILRKACFLAVGGFTTDYIVGDYEDSDLCLKLRAKQGVPLYMPAIELYHFERQSMPDDTDQRDRGSTVYNRALHTTKWGAQIDAANATAADGPHAQ